MNAKWLRVTKCALCTSRHCFFSGFGLCNENETVFSSSSHVARLKCFTIVFQPRRSGKYVCRSTTLFVASSRRVINFNKSIHKFTHSICNPLIPLSHTPHKSRTRERMSLHNIISRNSQQRREGRKKKQQIEDAIKKIQAHFYY